MALRAADRAGAVICRGRPYFLLSFHVCDLECLCLEEHRRGSWSWSKDRGQIESQLWSHEKFPLQQHCVIRSEMEARDVLREDWVSPVGPARLDWVCWFHSMRFLSWGVLYQIHVHRLDLLPEINPLVSCRTRFLFCPSYGPPPSDQSFQSACEMDGSSLCSSGFWFVRKTLIRYAFWGFQVLIDFWGVARIQVKQGGKKNLPKPWNR